MPGCIACGESKTRNIGIPRLHTAESRFRVIECCACGLRWSDPMPTRSELDAHYLKYYGQKDRRGRVRAGERLTRRLHTAGWSRRRHESFQRLIDRHARKGTLIDYGCGEGLMLAVARQHGWSVLGFDYSSEHVEALRAKGFDVRVATDLRSSGVGVACVDCLVAKHVIEHVVELEGFLADCRTVLRPGGVLALKTPSRTSLRARLGLADWHLVNPPEHQWSFQPRCFRLLLESHGFEVRHLRNDPLVDELVCIAGVREARTGAAPAGDRRP